MENAMILNVLAKLTQKKNTKILNILYRQLNKNATILNFIA